MLNKKIVLVGLAVVAVGIIFAMPKKAGAYDYILNYNYDHLEFNAQATEGTCYNCSCSHTRSFHVYSQANNIPLQTFVAACSGGSTYVALVDSNGAFLNGTNSSQNAPTSCTQWGGATFAPSTCLTLGSGGGNGYATVNLAPGDYRFVGVYGVARLYIPQIYLQPNAQPVLSQPTITSSSTQTPGINFVATDADVGDNITYTYSIDNFLYNIPGGTFTQGVPVNGLTNYGGSLSWGSHTVYVKADDGKGGVATSSFTFVLTNPTPTINSFTASQTIIKRGSGSQDSALSWSSNNTAGGYCTINGANQFTSGVINVTPPAGTTPYTLICYNSSGQATPPQTLNITVLDKGDVIVNVNKPAGVNGGGFTISYNGTQVAGWDSSRTYAGQPYGSWSVAVLNIGGFTSTISPSASQNLVGGESITFNINYSPDPATFKLSLTPTVFRPSTGVELKQQDGITIDIVTPGSVYKLAGPIRVTDRIDITNIIQDMDMNNQSGLGTITYRITNTDTGTVVENGKTIPAGTTINWVPVSSGNFRVDVTNSLNSKTGQISIRVPAISSVGQ